MSNHIFEVAQDPERALDHIVKQIKSWNPVLPGDDQAESDLVDKFLDLYELTSYYQVEEAFLSFRVLEAFASKITNDMLCEWLSIPTLGITYLTSVFEGRVIQSLGFGLGGSTATPTEVSH